LNAILYGLGFEILFGKKGVEGLTPVLTEELMHGSKLISVLESYVELEISNNQGKTITIKRYIRSEYDNRLVLVTDGARLTEADGVQGQYESYYLHDPGSAQYERGFHKFLAGFVGWDLPIVSTYKETEVPLYMDCIFPLFFIEQKRGWSNLQATTPTVFQIKNAQKLAVEFVLSLDVSEISKQKQEIQNRKVHHKAEWEDLEKELKLITSAHNGIIRNYPGHQVTLIKQDEMPFIAMKDGEDWIPIEQYLVKLRDSVHNLRSEIDLTDDAIDQNEQIKQLQETKESLFSKQLRIDSLQYSKNQEANTIRSLEERTKRLEVEIKNNRDIAKLEGFGAIIQSEIVKGECPTCHQAISEILLKQPLGQEYLTVEETIAFLGQQKEACSILLKQSEKMLDVRRKEMAESENEIDSLRTKIRDINSDLIQGADLPKVSLMRELIEKEQFLKRLELMQEQFEERIIKLIDLTEAWKNILEDQSKLPKDMFSKNDKEKLLELGNIFKNNVNKFQFSSKITTGIEMSNENYRPIIDGFHLGSGSSASDNIRIIWAYMLALQEISERFQCNHIGVSFFDEPGQHAIAKESKEEFYNQIKQMDLSSNQIIIATSEEEYTLNTMLKNVPCNLRSFDEKMIGRL